MTGSPISSKIALVTHRTETEKFLRAAVKAGLRLQEKSGGSAAGPGDGVETLRKIKASLRRKNATPEIK